MTLDELVTLAHEWARLGWAVQEQALDLLDGGDIADQNPNAMKLFADWLRDVEMVGDEVAEEAADLRASLPKGERAT